MSSTHSANPLVCSAGIATLKFIKKKKIIHKSKTLGLIFKKKILEISKKYSNLISITNSKGLIGAIIFKKFNYKSGTEIADDLTLICYNKGLLLVNTGRESVKLGPPLIINKKNLLKAFKIIDNSLEIIERKLSAK